MISNMSNINKINKIVILVLLLLVPPLCGCVSQNELPSGKINVATTIHLWEFITAVGGDKVEVTCWSAGSRAHTYEPTPSQMKMWQRQSSMS